MKAKQALHKICHSLSYRIRKFLGWFEYPKDRVEYRCPWCGYVIDAIEKEMAKQDYLCPSCHQKRFSQFDKEHISFNG